MGAVYLEKTDPEATLSAWLYCAMWQLYSADKAGLSGYVNWPHRSSMVAHQDADAFAKCPNMFEWYFEQPALRSAPPPGTPVWTWESCTELGTHCLMGQPLGVIKDWYRSNVVFNDEMKARAEALVAKYAIDFDNTIGIAWRGCDNVTDGRRRIPIETYFPYIDDILSREPHLRIFATAEETTVVEKVQARYPQTFCIDEFYSAPWGYPRNSHFINPASGYEKGVQTCGLIQLLSRCKHLIKNRSNMSYTASYLSSGNVVCIEHPEIGV